MEKTEPILLESNQNHATITDNGICTTLTTTHYGSPAVAYREIRNERTDRL